MTISSRFFENYRECTLALPQASLPFDAQKSNREHGMRKMYQKLESERVRGQGDQRGCVIYFGVARRRKVDALKGSLRVHTCTRKRSFARSIIIKLYIYIYIYIYILILRVLNYIKVY